MRSVVPLFWINEDTMNKLLSYVHILLVNILQCVRLCILKTNKYIFSIEITKQN